MKPQVMLLMKLQMMLLMKPQVTLLMKPQVTLLMKPQGHQSRTPDPKSRSSRGMSGQGSSTSQSL